ncbi:heavy-metal-associated domain-containing protein [Thauera sinica]|uniref:Heavy-metal-associated domain-containing protein n=1 Tax=Thauera sinica TaxID=2665146 RepID=A0ABW1AWG7_9RHOO|nr:heavy-metal-associated domain-containing protein [Thauera sp. K11]ATE61090.1 hypothetical protein CCZ27_15120 [Thauera sp. K11]
MAPGFDELRGGLAGVRIAHHIRGRVRLKLEPQEAAFELPDRRVRAFQDILDRIPGVHAVQLNLLARSCTVRYDPDVIPMQAWGDFMAGVDSGAAEILERILHDAWREIRNAEL